MPLASIGTGGDPLVHDPLRDHDLGVGEQVGSSPNSKAMARFEPCSLEQERRAVGEGRLGVDDHRQRVVVDDHLLGRVDRLRTGLGDDRGDDVADEADPVRRRAAAG